MTKNAYTGVDNLEIMVEAKNYNRFLENEVLSHAPGHSRAVLDFGAGTGFFARALRERGLPVSCIETDARLARGLGEAGFGVQASLAQVPSGSIDYIYSLNVLEHIADDRGILKEMARCLRPGGRVYIYVPAFPLLYSSMDRKVGHLRRYRLNPLGSLLNDAGFKILEIGYRDSLGFLATLLFKWLGNDRGDLNPTGIRLYDRVAFPISRALDRIFSGVLGKNAGVAAER